MDFIAGGRLTISITHADVGKRVSVRTRLPSGSGPRPARFTDTVGVLTAWEGGVLSITRRNGQVARLGEAEMVAAKVVPPAPTRPRGVPAASVAELTAVGARGWPALESERIGGWTVRAGAGWTHRANSGFRSGAGAPDLDRVLRWYAARGLPAVLHLTSGAEGTDELLDAELDRAGWRANRATVCQVAALAPLADRPPDERVVVGRALTDAWVRGNPAALRDPVTARRVLTGGPSVWFATVPDADGEAAAVGRCVVDGRWAGFAALRVAPAHRRQGLATAMMAELARAALGDGASAAYLQVEADNAEAQTLYRGLGFADHHHYQYREHPGGAHQREGRA
ncbi:GNAT family N-acetyltransferase [Streptomyces sp. B6B3]|uniref:GNAT family N-acetyltransferase n=1 Tax=Streptomyces sp. B6B3 TaxID=3153570 RepID=UPI00325CF233